MAAQDVDELRSLNAPHINIEWLSRTRADDVTRRLDSQARQLRLLIRPKSTEILVFDQVKGSHCPVGRATQQSIRLLRQEFDVSD